MASRAANRLSQEHRRRLSLLSSTVAAGVTSVALGADPADIDTWYLSVADGLLDRVVAGYGQSRRMGADYLRRHGALQGHRVAQAAVPLATAQARTSLRVTGPVAFKTAIDAGHAPAQAVQVMASQMSGSASRLALQGDRDTLHETMAAGGGVVGYRRVLGGKGCDFCAMLASRGAVYLSERTASRTDSGRRYHDHCACYPEPLYAHEDEPSEVRLLQRFWRQATQGRSGDDARRAWRRFWDKRQRAIATAEPGGAVKVLPAASSGAASAGGAVAAVTVRPALAAAGTLAGVEKAFRAEYRRLTGRRVATNSHGDVQTAREHFEGLLRGVERFPGVNLTAVGRGTKPHYAQAITQSGGRGHLTVVGGGSGRVEFNEAFTGDRQKYLDSLAADVKAGWHPAGTASPVSIGAHEFGHVLDVGTLGEAIRPDLQRLIFRRATERDQALDALRAAGQPMSAEDFIAGRGAEGLMRREVGEYALKNHSELVAEAFADVMVNGPAASRLSREIVDLLEAEYRKGGLHVGVASTLPSAPVPRKGSPRRLHDEATLRAAYTFTDPVTGFRTEVDQIFHPGDPNPDLNEISKYRVVPPGRIMIRMDVLDASGRKVGESVRTIHPPGQARVNHNYLVLDKGIRGQGFATRFNAQAEDAYRANGIKIITLHADIDVGGYAWARAGYDFRSNQTRSATVAWAYVQAITRNYPPEVTREFRDLMMSGRATPLDLAMVGHTSGALTWPGKEIMLESDWQGVKTL